MLRTSLLIISTMFAMSCANAQDRPRQDPSSDPEIVKLADISSDCITRNYLAARDAARQDSDNETALSKNSLRDSVRQCRPAIKLLKSRYDEVFGPGMGDAFLRQSYFPDLARAVMERILDTPEKRRQTEALQKSRRYISGGNTSACRYKFLLDKNIQEKINRSIAGMQLREDLIGKRFAFKQTVIVTLELPPDEKNALTFDINNEEDSKNCFPNFKKRIKELHDEYDRKVKIMAARSQKPS